MQHFEPHRWKLKKIKKPHVCSLVNFLSYSLNLQPFFAERNGVAVVVKEALQMET